jgi:glycine cleavage system T protein (aminomethyltransferase)
VTHEPLRRTSLYDAHRAAGGRLVPFAGWELPVQYVGIADEHRAVRTRAGLFDVSHMGEVLIEGPDALAAVQRLITNDAGRLAVGQGLYTPICTPAAGIVDDVTVFRTGEQRYFVVVNAGTRAKDVAWIRAHAAPAAVRDVSDELALLALQGPKAESILTAATGRDLSALRPFHLIENVSLAERRVMISRTGYTGEDGFEVACQWDHAPHIWQALLDAGESHGLVPAGLGARDTLRLEAGFMLYGNDIDEETSPLEAPLNWTVKLEKPEFIGRDTLVKQKADGVRRRLVALQPQGRAIPRHGSQIFVGGQPVGIVTSGTFSPTLQRAVAMGYVPTASATPGTMVEIDVRGTRIPAAVEKLPFYRRPKA